MQLSRTTGLALITAYWSCVSVGSLALLFSIVVTLWGPYEPDLHATLSQRRTWCIGQLALLHAELVHETQAAFAAQGPMTAPLQRRRHGWQGHWQHHLEAIQKHCQQPGELTAAVAQVASLAQRYDAVVLAWQSVHEGLEIPLQAALRRLADPWRKADSGEPAPGPNTVVP